MKPVVIVLALLAAAKLAHQEYLFRTGTRDAIVGAYKGHATEACQREALSTHLAVSLEAWVNPAAIKLVIGKTTLDVKLWQLDNGLWNARYRNPYLVLTAAEREQGATITCEYDIVNAAAAVKRM